MSDFSVTAICPYCHSRFCPDDGGCGCIGEENAHWHDDIEHLWGDEEIEEEDDASL